MHVGIEKVEKAILENAEKKSAGIIGEAKRKADDLRAKSDADARELERKVLGDAEKQAELARERAVADARMQASNELGNVKNKVLESVFDDALDGLVKWKKKKPKEYQKWVSRLVASATKGKSGARGAGGALGAGGAQLVFASDDARLFKNAFAAKFAASFSDELSGGVIVRLPSENIEVDESFEQKIRNAKSVCVVDVAKLLFGEKEKTRENEKKSE